MNRPLLKLVVAGLIAAAPAFALAQQKVLKFIPQADLRILDPIATTAYILIGIQLEEHDLLAELPEYAQYRKRVPMLVPFSKRSA